jgi:hypothetical protein
MVSHEVESLKVFQEHQLCVVMVTDPLLAPDATLADEGLRLYVHRSVCQFVIRLLASTDPSPVTWSYPGPAL